MFDPALNATFLPSELPREGRLALWATPAQLRNWVPLTPPSLLTSGASPGSPLTANSSTEGSSPATVIELLGPDGTGPVPVQCHDVPLLEVIDDLAAVEIHSKATRSVRALGQVIRCALRLVSEGSFHPSIAADGNDIWESTWATDDLTFMKALAEWVPPESYRAGRTNAEESVRALFNAVTDLMPRSPAARVSLGARPWASLERTEVSHLGQDLLRAGVQRRSVLQLRIQMPDRERDRAQVHLFVRLETTGFRAVSAADLWSGAEPLDTQTEQDLLFLLRRAGRIWPPLAEALEEPTPSRFAVETERIDELLDGVAEDLQSAGVEIMVPAELLRRMQPAPRVTLGTDPEAGFPERRSSGLFSVDSLCEVDWTVRVGGRELSGAELDALIESKRRLLRLDDGWIVLDRGVIDRLRERETMDAATALGELLRAGVPAQADSTHQLSDLASPDAASAPAFSVISSEDPAPHVLAHAEVAAPIAEFLASVRDAMVNDDFVVSTRLNGELRPYQRAGVAWLTALISAGFGGVLADDMGLGKTIQVIAGHLWVNEYRPLGEPGLSTLVVAPAGLLHNWEAELRRWAPTTKVHRFHGPDRSMAEVGPNDVVLSTYGIVRREINVIRERDWGLVVADEAQAMKNHLSATARAMRLIPSAVRFALTGTPVENHLGDLWSIFDWTTPGLLGRLSSFEQQIVKPIERREDSDAQEALSRVVAPFMLRRTKSDPRIIPELPPRTITDHHIPITDEQALLYRAASAEILDSIRSSSGMARRGAIFKLLTALKQISNHPAQFLAEDSPLPGRSEKFDLCMDMVGEIVESGQSVVIFTQYVRMARLLLAGLEQLAMTSGILHGGATLKERNELVERFQRQELRAIVVSLKAGGIGLNLTAATHVIHYDRWWNPAVENQASDRVWRIGQTKPVQVHRLVTLGTIEEKIATLLESKQRLADAVLSEAAWITEMSDQELMDMVRLDSSSGSADHDE